MEPEEPELDELELELLLEDELDELLELDELELEELDEEELGLDGGGTDALELALEVDSQPATITVRQSKLAGKSPAGMESFFIYSFLPQFILVYVMTILYLKVQEVNIFTPGAFKYSLNLLISPYP